MCIMWSYWMYDDDTCWTYDDDTFREYGVDPDRSELPKLHTFFTCVTQNLTLQLGMIPWYTSGFT